MRIAPVCLVALSLGCGSPTEQTFVTISADPNIPAVLPPDAAADVVDAAAPAEANTDADASALPPVRCKLRSDGSVAVCGTVGAAAITWATGTCSINPERNGYCPPGTQCCVFDVNSPPIDCDYGTCL